MHRRYFLAQIGSAAIAAALPAQSRLRNAAAARNLLVGTAVSRRELERSEFTRLLGEQASIVVCENDMKWGLIHPQIAQYDFSGGDVLMQFAETHGQMLRGHNLCWHEQLPHWFESAATRENAAESLRLHIATVAGHYRGRIHSWDVVNEAIQIKDNQPGGFRNSIWYRLLGPEFIAVAFRAASEADPHALLTYNDYDLEQDGEAQDAKRAAVLAMLRGLRDHNVPIQAVGLQSHLHARATPDKWDALHTFLWELEQLDLTIFVTELDVDDRELPGDIAQRDAAVASVYKSYLSNVLEHRSVKAILTWGLTDADTWLTGFLPRKDGNPQRPLPFDPDLKPTPAFQAMLEALNGAATVTR